MVLDRPVQWGRGAAVQRGRSEHVQQQLGDLLIAGGGDDAGGACRGTRGGIVAQRDRAVGQQARDAQVR